MSIWRLPREARYAFVSGLFYDSDGNLRKIRNPLEEEITFLYDEAGHVVEIRVCDMDFMKSAYDAKGNLISRSDGLGRESRFEYNKHGRPVKIIQPDRSEILLSYDAKGNIREIRDPSGRNGQCFG